MASNAEAYEGSDYAEAVRARAFAESLLTRPVSWASTEQITRPLPEQHSERRLIGSIDFSGEMVGVGLMDSIRDQKQIEEEAVRAHKRLSRDFQPYISQAHIIDSVDRVARSISRMLRPEQLYVTAFLTAVEVQSFLRRIYY